MLSRPLQLLWKALVMTSHLEALTVYVNYHVSGAMHGDWAVVNAQ